MRIDGMQERLSGRLSPLTDAFELLHYWLLRREDNFSIAASGFNFLLESLPGFERTFPYVLQATRNDPHKYEHDGSVVYLGRKTGEPEGASSDSLPLVIPCWMGPASLDMIMELAEIAGSQGIATIVKNIPKEDVGESWVRRVSRPLEPVFVA